MKKKSRFSLAKKWIIGIHLGFLVWSILVLTGIIDHDHWLKTFRIIAIIYLASSIWMIYFGEKEVARKRELETKQVRDDLEILDSDDYNQN